MTQKQIKVFEELLESKETKGKKLLHYLLWMNTTEPKFKIGECFEVTDRGHRMFGYPVQNFKARITATNTFLREEEWRYELELEVECDGKIATTKVYKYEHELIKRCDDNKNILGVAKSKYEDTLDI